jgi:hypothetical protein
MVKGKSTAIVAMFVDEMRIDDRFYVAVKLACDFYAKDRGSKGSKDDKGNKGNKDN